MVIFKNYLIFFFHFLKNFLFLHKELPYNDYIEYFGPDFRLHVPSTNMENLNSKEYLERYKNKILENIRRIGKPSMAIHDVFINI